MKNKRGQIGMIMFFSILLIILILGFIGSMVVSIIDIASDEITPIMTDLGMAGTTNMSEVAEYTFTPLNNIVQMLPLLLALAYGFALIFSIIFVMGYSTLSPHPVFIGFYFALMILLIFGAIVISNMYEDIYTGDDDIAVRLQDQAMTSYLTLYSPFILSFIAAIAGVFLFTRTSSDAASGGFDV